MSPDPQFGPDRIAALYQLMQSAGDRILAVYGDASRWQTDRKADDSPVTAADIAASETLVAGLPTVIDRPVLSEEAAAILAGRSDGWHP